MPGQGGLATLVTVLGGKPIWDTYHTMFNKPTKGTVSAVMALAGTKFMQVAFDSL